MTHYAKSQIRHNGKVYEEGDKLPSLEKKELQALISAGVVSSDKEEVEEEEAVDTDEDEEEEVETDEGDEYDAMTGAELKEELKARDLAVSGKVEELRERLRAKDKENEDEAGESDIADDL